MVFVYGDKLDVSENSGLSIKHGGWLLTMKNKRLCSGCNGIQKKLYIHKKNSKVGFRYSTQYVQTWVVIAEINILTYFNRETYDEQSAKHEMWLLVWVIWIYNNLHVFTEIYRLNTVKHSPTIA